MSIHITPPRELARYIGSEKTDFLVKAHRAHTIKSGIGVTLFGFIFTLFPVAFSAMILTPLLKHGQTKITINDVPTTITMHNLHDLWIPALILAVFYVIGVPILVYGISMLLQQGGYFAGTPKRLISFRKGTFRSIDWENFSGDIQVNGENERGSLRLLLRTTKHVHNRDNKQPDAIEMVGIRQVFAIEEICRRRIKENDPTPPQV